MLRKRERAVPVVSVGATTTGENVARVTNIDFAGGMLKETRLEKHGKGLRLVIHGTHELDLFYEGLLAEAKKYFEARHNIEVAEKKAAEEARKPTPVSVPVTEPAPEIVEDTVPDDISQPAPETVVDGTPAEVSEPAAEPLVSTTVPPLEADPKTSPIPVETDEADPVHGKVE